MASVTLLWLDAVGDGPTLRACRAIWQGSGKPPGEAREEAAAVAWRRRVGAAVETAIDRVYPLLVEKNRIDELFRYRPVDGWAESLGKAPGRAAAAGLEVPLHG